MSSLEFDDAASGVTFALSNYEIDRIDTVSGTY